MDENAILNASDEVPNNEIANNEVPNKKTNRGRKPKEVQVGEQEDKIHNKRGRKKKCIIDSMNEFRNGGETEKLIFTNTNPTNTISGNVTQLAFGSLNLVLTTTDKTDSKELRKQMDLTFGISETEKAPEVLSQDPGNKSDIFTIKKNAKSTGIGSGTGTGGSENEVKTEYKSVKNIYKILGDHSETEWPTKTDVLCWWCCHSFDTPPVPCPINYDRVCDKFKVRGIFCSWSCSAAYSIHNFKSLTYIYLFRQHLIGSLVNSSELIEDVTISPDKTVLKSFGGFMSIEDFRNFNNKKNHSIIVSTDNISYDNQEILESYIETRSKK
jgi:hypothetical protein